MFLDFQQKRKIKDFFYSKVVIVILLGLTIFSTFSTFKVYLKMSKSSDEYKKSESKFVELEAKKSELLSKIENIQTESGLEREIRSKFSVSRPDEKVVVIVPEEDSQIKTNDEKVSFWSKFKKFFNF